jgi:hypothetical protein
MKGKLLMTTATAVLWAGMALALTADEVVQDFQDQGFTSIEVEEGPTQIKVEASTGPGSDRVEAIYDKETGAEVSREVYPGEGGEVDPGVDVDQRDRDFSGSGSDDGDDDDDDDDDDDEDEDEDDDHGGGGDDDDGDDGDNGDDGDHGGGGDDDDGDDGDHGGGGDDD